MIDPENLPPDAYDQHGEPAEMSWWPLIGIALGAVTALTALGLLALGLYNLATP